MERGVRGPARWGDGGTNCSRTRRRREWPEERSPGHWGCVTFVAENPTQSQPLSPALAGRWALLWPHRCVSRPHPSSPSERKPGKSREWPGRTQAAGEEPALSSAAMATPRLGLSTDIHFSPSWKPTSSRRRCWQMQFLVEPLPGLQMATFSLCPHMEERGLWSVL